MRNKETSKVEHKSQQSKGVIEATSRIIKVFSPGTKSLASQEMVLLKLIIQK
jgi:hypothetical protein